MAVGELLCWLTATELLHRTLLDKEFVVWLFTKDLSSCLRNLLHRNLFISFTSCFRPWLVLSCNLHHLELRIFVFRRFYICAWCSWPRSMLKCCFVRNSRIHWTLWFLCYKWLLVLLIDFLPRWFVQSYTGWRWPSGRWSFWALSI